MRHLCRYRAVGSRGTVVLDFLYYEEEGGVYILHGHPTILRGSPPRYAPPDLTRRYPKSWCLYYGPDRTDWQMREFIVDLLGPHVSSGDCRIRVVPVPGCPKRNGVTT